MCSVKQRALLAAAAVIMVVFAVRRGVGGTSTRAGAAESEEATRPSAGASFWDEHRARAQNRTVAGLTHAEEGAWRGSFYFVQLADPQLGMLRRDASWREELAMLALAIKHVNRLRPRFVVVSGDLVNGFPGTPEAPDQAAAFERELARLDPSVALILEPGNHDLGQRPTGSSMRAYRERFGDDYLRFWVGGALFVSLNSQLVKAPGAPGRAAHDSWTAEAFAAARTADRVVVLSHICPFVGAPDEAEGWANWPKDTRRAVLELATKAGAELWLCGHLHGNAVARHGRLEVVTSSAVGSLINWTRPPAEVAVMGKPDFRTTVGHPPVVAGPASSGLRVVRVDEGGFRHRWYPLADVPARLEDCKM